MRRTDREVTDHDRIHEIIQSCHCCRLGFADREEVYIVPLDFGYTERAGKRTFYFHGAKEGRKIELIARTHRAGFELDTGYELMRAQEACAHSARYQSVIGSGHIALVEDPEEKKEALQAIMLHSAGKGAWSFAEPMLEAISVIRLDVEKLSCKEHL